MSRTGRLPQPKTHDRDSEAWEIVEEHRDLLEEIVEDDIDAFTEHAENLLDALDERDSGGSA